MESDHTAKFGGHRHSNSGDMFLVVEEEDSRLSRFNYCLSLKDITLNHTAYHINNCVPGHTHNWRRKE